MAIRRDDPDFIYVGARGSGIWKTENGGGSWISLTDELPTRTISAITIDPNDQARVFAWMPFRVPGISAGLFRSQNGGQSWDHISTQDLGVRLSKTLVIRPNNSDHMMIAGDKGVWLSTDGGQNWTLSLDAPPDTHDHRITHHPVESDVVFAFVAQKGIYRTDNFGASWTGPLANGLPESFNFYYSGKVAFCRDSPSYAYAIVTLQQPGTPFLTVYRSTDGGTSWQSRTTSDAEPQLWNNVRFLGVFDVDAQDPGIVYFGGVQFMRSTQGGQAFKSVGVPPHVDHHALAFDPIISGVVYTGCDGGIYRSAKSGAKGSWSFIGTGITNAELYDLALHPTDDQIAIAGTQDNLGIRYDGHPSHSWKQLPHTHGDTTLVAFDNRDPAYAYAVGQNTQEIKRSTDGGQTFPDAISRSLSRCGISGEHLSRRASDVFSDGTSSHTIRVTCGSLWAGPHASSGQPFDWIEEFDPPGTSRATAWTSDDIYRVEYVGLTNGQVWARRFADETSTWHQVFQHPAGRAIVSLAMDTFEPGRIYALLAGRGKGVVFLLKRTSDSPSSVLQGFDISGLDTSLVAVPDPFPSERQPNAIAVDRLNRHTVYVATDHGIYRGRTIDEDATWRWELFNDGFPPSDTRAIEIHPVSGALFAATFGRGAFRVDTAPPIGSRVAASGRVVMLRVHQAGTAYGGPPNEIDADVVFALDSLPRRGFGFRLRKGKSLRVQRAMLAHLRDCFWNDRPVRIEYVRRNLWNNTVDRVISA